MAGWHCASHLRSRDAACAFSSSPRACGTTLTLGSPAGPHRPTQLPCPPTQLRLPTPSAYYASVIADATMATPSRTNLHQAEDFSTARLVNTALSLREQADRFRSSPGPFLDVTAVFGGDFPLRSPAKRLGRLASKASASGN
jgi:hypothetical protein